MRETESRAAAKWNW